MSESRDSAVLAYADRSLRPRLWPFRALIVLLAVAVPAGVFVWRVRAEHRRQEAGVAAVKMLGGTWQAETDSPWHRVAGRRWAKYFDRVRRIDVPPTVWTVPGAWDQVGRLDSVRELNAEYSTVDVPAIRGMSGLRVLRLAGTGVGDRSVAVLAGLPRLEVLDLRETRVTDASVPVLMRMTTLRELRIAGSGITRPGLDQLRAALPNCTMDRVLEP
jgi:hypothetical protein